MKRYLRPIIQEALRTAGLPDDIEVVVEPPRRPDRGDAVTNAALAAAALLGEPPQLIAERIAAAMRIDSELIEWIRVSPRGFINIRFTPAFHHRRLPETLHAVGRTTSGKDRSVLLLHAEHPNPISSDPLKDARILFAMEALARIIQRTGAATHVLRRTYPLAENGTSEGSRLPGGYDRILIAAGNGLGGVPPDELAAEAASPGHPDTPIEVIVPGRVTLIPEEQNRGINPGEPARRYGERVVRFMLLGARLAAPLRFDCRRAAAQSSANPLFHVEYPAAHALAILRHAGKGEEIDNADPAPLTDREELELIKQLAAFPETLDRAAQEYAPERIGEHLARTAEALTAFYSTRQILVAQPAELRTARLRLLSLAVRTTVVGLEVLGLEFSGRI